jgi:hypothetical protein
MKIKISDELYERLKNCVVDPFDDTPESVISRLMNIVDKARARWSSWDIEEQAAQPEAASPEAAPPETVSLEAASEDGQPQKSEHWKEQCEAVL